MSRRQWGHGYAAGLIDGRRQKPIHEKIYECLKNWKYLDGDSLSEGIQNIGLIDNHKWILGCPFHYQLSPMTGNVYQYQSHECLLTLDLSYTGCCHKFPFVTDCGWYGNIILLYRALLRVSRDFYKDMRMETNPNIAADKFYPEEMIPLSLPKIEHGRRRGWAPEFAWMAFGGDEEEKQLIAGEMHKVKSTSRGEIADLKGDVSG